VPAAPVNVSVVKEALTQLGLARRTVRPPISELSAAERDEVAAILADLAEPGELKTAQAVPAWVG
jgi:dihydrodipicolinate synthase/N-acetylneuraminate lyase